MMKDGSKMRWRPGGTAAGATFQRGNSRADGGPSLPSSSGTGFATTAAAAAADGHRQFTIPHNTGYVEDYGDMEAGKRGRGLGGGGFMSSGPILCLYRWRRRVCSPHFVAAAAMASSFVAVQFAAEDDGGLLVTVASALTVFMAMLVLFQQRKIRTLGTLRAQHNELRRRAGYFTQERERLHRTMDRMDARLAQLHYVPQELHKLTKNGQHDADRLAEIVRQTNAVQEAIRNRLRQRVLQQILGVVVNADKNSDWALTPKEVEVLTLRLRSVEGVEFNETKFREALAVDASLHSVLKIIRSLEERDDEYQHGDAVFKIKLDVTLNKPHR